MRADDDTELHFRHGPVFIYAAMAIDAAFVNPARDKRCESNAIRLQIEERRGTANGRTASRHSFDRSQVAG